MIQKKKQPFNDGIVKIYRTDEDGEPAEEKYRPLRFEEKVVGSKRYFDARTVNEEITRMISVPYGPEITTCDVAEIEGRQYDIVQCQPAKNDNPPKTTLSLNIRRGAGG